MSSYTRQPFLDSFSWDSDTNQPFMSYDMAEGYELKRESFSAAQSTLTYYMEYMFEKWFVALPQFFGWMYLQKMAGLP